MKYELPRGYLSASSIGMLHTCPKQFEFRYVKNIVIPPGKALVLGSSVHKVFETYYSDAMTSSCRLSPTQVAELTGDVFEAWLDENENTLTDADKKEAHSLLPGMAFMYVENVGRHIKPLAVEQEIRFETGDGVPLLAYVDLRHEMVDAATGEKIEEIADYKVTSKRWDPGRLRNSLQFNLYSLMTGIGDIEIHNLLKESGRAMKRPSTDPSVTDYATNLRVLRHHFDGSQVRHFEQLVESAARLVTSGVFMPCDPASWACTPEWCGYWGLCRGR